MIELKDQLGRSVTLAAPAKRIVSLVPSQTELLYDLGLEAEVVGITKFCVHPDEWFRSKTRIGGTKTLDLEKIRSLQPDLIIGNKEENTREEIDLLSKEFPIYMSDIFTLEDALSMIEDTGLLTNREKESYQLIGEINNGLESLPAFNGRVLYFMWNNPLMVAGQNTFIGHIIEATGFENALADKEIRYQEISHEEIRILSPDYLLLSSEPFPFNQELAGQLTNELGIPAYIVDGEMFSWYGSRLKLLPDYLRQLHSEIYM